MPTPMHMPMLGHAHARLSLAPTSVPSHIYLEGAFSLDQPTRQQSTPYLAHPVPPVGIVVSESPAPDRQQTVSARHSRRSSLLGQTLHDLLQPPRLRRAGPSNNKNNRPQLQLQPRPAPSGPHSLPANLHPHNLQLATPSACRQDRPAINHLRPLLASLPSAHRRPPSPRPPSALISLTPDSRVLALNQGRHPLPHGRFVAPRHFPLANRPRLVVWIGAGPLSSLRGPQRLLGRRIVDSSSTPPALIKPAPRPPLPTRPGPDSTATPSADHAGTAASKPPKAKTDGLPAPDPPASHRDHRTSLDLPNKHRTGESLLAGHI